MWLHLDTFLPLLTVSLAASIGLSVMSLVMAQANRRPPFEAL